MEPPRALAHPGRPLGQGHPLVAAQGSRTPDRRPARPPLGSPEPQPAALPRLPAARGAAAALPPARPDTGARSPGRLARLGQPLAAQAVRPPRPHPARAPRRDPRRDPARALQRPPGRPQQQDPPHQPPQLRLPLRRRPDRPRLPLLHRHRHHAAAMNFTHNSTGAPNMTRAKDGARRGWSPPAPSTGSEATETALRTNHNGRSSLVLALVVGAGLIAGRLGVEGI